jgi:predicted tellurium resistance membrane protein TerC
MDWISWMAQPEAWTALVVLAILEIVLGIDNIIFISIRAWKKYAKPSVPGPYTPTS